MKLIKRLSVLLLVLVALLIGALYAFPKQMFSLATQLERQRADLERKTSTIDEETWYFLEARGGRTPTIVLLHGFGGSKENWVRFAKHLDGYRVIIPDLPGFGESAQHDDWQYDLSAQAPRLKAFIDDLGIGKYHLVGNSMGGNLAAYYTALYPDNVRTLTMISNSGVKADHASPVDKAVARGESPLLVGDVANYDAYLDLMFVKRPFIPGPFKKLLAKEAVARRDFNAKIYSDYSPQRRGWLSQYLPRIKQPVLVLWGDKDQVTDVSATATLQAQINDLTVLVMEDVGHLPFMEEPKQSAQHLRSFLRAITLKIDVPRTTESEIEAELGSS